ncbi:hypothetical protein Tco_0729213 [Tanacetum coccineum]|uniref:Uncharacterized protein n=1 Tax=Tanacetum coccineum TaxID=301880 RepID=A0ABQ4YQY7_9ASTR
MLSPQGSGKAWNNLRFSCPSPDVLKPQIELKQKPGTTSTEKVQNPNLENTAHVPSSGEEDSIFIEIPKPKAKETVNLDPNPNSYPSKLPYPERMKVREHDKPSAQQSKNNRSIETSALGDQELALIFLPPSIYKKLGLKAWTTYSYDTRACLPFNSHPMG